MVKRLAQYLEIQQIYGKLEGILLGEYLGYTDGKVLRYDEGIKMGSTDGKVLVTILGNLNVITLGIDVGTDLGYLNGYFDTIHWLLWWPERC